LAAGAGAAGEGAAAAITPLTALNAERQATLWLTGRRRCKRGVVVADAAAASLAAGADAAGEGAAAAVAQLTALDPQ